jgi:transcriptional regulator with XRE-family HTH domain
MSNPSAARLLLGAELRWLRERVGLLVEDAAQILECSTAKISRLENGKGKPYWRDIRDLLRTYDVMDPDKLAELRALFDAGIESDWTDKFKDVWQAEGISDHLNLDGGGRFVVLERDATELKWFERDLVPGLLQTPDYIGALQQFAIPSRPSHLAQRFTEFRVQRQQKVFQQQSEPPRIISVVSELALIGRKIFPTPIMKQQLDHLIKVLGGEMNWIEFHILPFENEPPDAVGGPFYIIKSRAAALGDVVYIEGRDKPNYLNSKLDVNRFEQRLESLVSASLTRSESLERLTQELLTLEQ